MILFVRAVFYPSFPHLPRIADSSCPISVRSHLGWSFLLFISSTLLRRMCMMDMQRYSRTSSFPCSSILFSKSMRVLGIKWRRCCWHGGLQALIIPRFLAQTTSFSSKQLYGENRCVLCYFSLFYRVYVAFQSVASKPQVLSELQFTLGQMERALQANPSDRASEGHIHVLRQVSIQFFRRLNRFVLMFNVA